MLWWMWVKRLTFLPVRWLVASMRSLVLDLPRQLIRHGDAVDARPDDRVVDIIIDLLAEKVDLQMQIGEALDELLRCSESHACHSFLAPSVVGAALAFPGVGALLTGALAR